MVKISRIDFRFYAGIHMLAGALCLFFLAREALPHLPDPRLLGAAGAALAILYLVSISTWALNKCLRYNYSLWLAPLSGGLAGMILGVGLEVLFLQGSAREGLAVNGCLAAGSLVSLLLFSKRFLKAQMDTRGRSGRMRSWA